MVFAGPVARADVVRRIEAHPLGEGPDAMREGFRRLVLGDDPTGLATLAGYTHGDCEAGRMIAPPGVPPGRPGAIWFHGGGYVFGAPETHLRAAARLAAGIGREVLLPRYPLAPEHRWPAPLDAALALAAQFPGAALVGDSAGGHLALVAALARARAGTPPPALALCSPNTDRSGRNRTRAAMSPLDPMVDDADDRRLGAMVFGDGFDPADPEISPLLADLSLLPPTHVEVGDPEVLRDDAVLLHEAAGRQGGRTRLVVTPGLLHMAQLWTPWWDEATASIDRAAAALASVLGPAGARD